MIAAHATPGDALWERFNASPEQKLELLPPGPRAHAGLLAHLPAAAGARQPAGGGRAEARRPARPPARIDRKRLEKTFADQARIGATARGGLTRLALSDEDR